MLLSLPPDFHLVPSPSGGLAIERGRFHLPLGEMGPELRTAVETLAAGGAAEEELTSGVSGLDLLRLHQLLADLAGAPERFQGWTADPKADLWSLGVLLYEAAAGVRPFRGEGPEAVVHAILSEPPAPLSPRLDPIVLGYLEKDPNKRGSLRSPLDDIR